MKMSLSETFKSQIEMLALQLAQAMVEANAASAVVTAAEAHRETIATRVAALAGDRVWPAFR
jgi:hypothetical protein